MKTHAGALRLLSPAERADYNILTHLDRDARLAAIKRPDLIGWQPAPASPGSSGARAAEYRTKSGVKERMAVAQAKYRAKPEVRAQHAKLSAEYRARAKALVLAERADRAGVK